MLTTSWLCTTCKTYVTSKKIKNPTFCNFCCHVSAAHRKHPGARSKNEACPYTECNKVDCVTRQHISEQMITAQQTIVNEETDIIVEQNNNYQLPPSQEEPKTHKVTTQEYPQDKKEIKTKQIIFF